MFNTDDTIVAIATPPGRGGIGVVRISGPRRCRDRRRALTGGEARSSRGTRRFARIARGRRAPIKSIVTYFPAPHSYTGEDVVEISAHGSPVLLRAIVEAAMDARRAARRARRVHVPRVPAERIDLVQAEAVRDLVDAVTPLQARAAYDQLEGTLTGEIREIDSRLFDLIVRLEASLDFPDEGYHFIESGDAAREIASLIGELDALLATRGARPADPRRPAGRDRGPAERGQIEPVQPARRRGARDRDGRARDDARSADGDASTSTACR